MTDSLPALLLQRAADTPHAIALRKKDFGVWRQYTWAEYAQRAARVGLGLRALGVKAGDRVAVHSENRPAWLLADLGIQGIGAATVGIYPTSPAAEVEYLLVHSEARVLIAEDEEQLDKALLLRGQLPQLRELVVIDARGVRCLDEDHITRFVDALDVGCVNVWEVPGYRTELTPFGGIKDSGLGYKEGVQEAMKSFTNTKTYSIPW